MVKDYFKSTGEENVGDYKVVNVYEKITKFLVSEIERADAAGIINWEKFESYCLEFGMINPPNILTVPDPVIIRCIKEAKKRAKYKDKLNCPYESI